MQAISLSIRGYILVAVWAVTAVISFALSNALYQTQKDEYLAGIDSKLVTGATMARAIMGADYHDALVDATAVPPDVYLQSIDRYNKVCLENGFQYLWSNLFLHDGSIVFTSSTSTSKDVTNGDHALFFDVHSDPTAFAPVIQSGKLAFSTFRNEWGSGRMVLIPYRDALGRTYVFGASISIAELSERLNETLLHSITIFLIVLGIGTVVSLLLARAISEPLRRITDVAKGIASGTYGLHANVNGGGKELASLASSINTMSDAIEENKAALEAIVAERTRELAGKVRELDLQKMAIQESEHKYRTIFETSKVGLALCDMDGRLLECNQAYLDMIGYSLDEARQLSYWDLTPEEYAQQEYEQLSSLRENGFYGPYEKQYIRKDGALIPVLLNGTLLCEPDNGSERIWSIVQDISTQKDASQRLSMALQRAEESDRAKSEFLSAMSHELRTPLNAILGFAQLLRMDAEHPLSDEQAEEVDHILRSGDHLLELIKEVLDLSRIEAGKLSLNMTAVSVQPLLEDCMSLIRNMARSRNISQEVSLNELQGKAIWADEFRLKQVFLNLLSNAVKYNVDGGSITVIGSVEDAETARLEVRDTGTGIAEDKKSTIFEPFSRAGHAANEVEGTGIGLTITKKLVELMNGRIGFESDEGVGTIFWIEFPLTEAGANQGELSFEYQPEDILPDTGKELRLIYIEDDPVNVKLMASFLKRYGKTEMLTAHTAELGIAMAETQHPDIILMDINLPGIDGVSATRQLRENQLTASIPIIMITANAMEVDVHNGLEAGADAYLTKPLDLTDFLKTIDRVLANTQCKPAP